MSKVILKAEAVRKAYRSGTERLEILKGVNFTIRSGESVAIIGKSGVGKSTLLHILGLLDTADAGRITLDETDIASIGPVARARLRNKRFGFVFQFYHLLPELNALENVYLPAMIASGTFSWFSVRSKMRNHARELLAHVGLSERTRHKPKQLSGGERQRVAIARALINKPAVLFCDEPTGNLDDKTSQTVTRLLWRLKSELDQTLVMVTHEASLAGEADRTVHMVDGRIMKEGA